MTRATPDRQARADRLRTYETWIPPTRLDFEQLIGHDRWAEHWERHAHIVDLMREAQTGAAGIRELVRSTYLNAHGRPS